MNELEWLTDHRPVVAEPDEGTTAYSRTALLAYAVRTGEEGPSRDRVTAGAGTARDDHAPRHRDATTERAAPRRGSRAPRKAPLYALAVAVFAIAIVVGASALPSGEGPARKLVAPATAEAALVKFSNRIAAEPTPTGDATLVVRHQAYPDGKNIPGADLYLDNGRYYYAPTLAGLHTAGASALTDTDFMKRQMVAAEAAIGSPPDAARQRMVAAILGDVKMRPGVKSTRALDDNHIWGACMDALIAGAGDTKVRAGVMRLLATIASVKVEDHGATLDLRNTAWSPDTRRP